MHPCAKSEVTQAPASSLPLGIVASVLVMSAICTSEALEHCTAELKKTLQMAISSKRVQSEVASGTGHDSRQVPNPVVDHTAPIWLFLS